MYTRVPLGDIVSITKGENFPSAPYHALTEEIRSLYIVAVRRREPGSLTERRVHRSMAELQPRHESYELFDQKQCGALLTPIVPPRTRVPEA